MLEPVVIVPLGILVLLDLVALVVVAVVDYWLDQLCVAVVVAAE
jgi:hypothetical protein